MKIHLKTLCVLERLFFFFAFVCLSQISLVPFAQLRGGFFQSRFGFLSLVPSLLRESDADSFDALFALCVCVFLSLSDV